jgi:integrase
MPRPTLTSLKRDRYTTGQKAFSKDEYEKILLACEDPTEKMMVLIGCSLGLRREDLVRLRIDNINFDESSMSYHEKKKGDKIHTVPLGPKLRQELLFYLKGHDSLYIFPNQQKSKSPHMSGRTAYNRLQMLCKRAGVTGRPFHALRATAIKLKQREGWTVEQVAALINDRPSTVQDHYSTPSMGELHQAMKAMEGI